MNTKIHFDTFRYIFDTFCIEMYRNVSKKPAVHNLYYQFFRYISIHFDTKCIENVSKCIEMYLTFWWWKAMFALTLLGLLFYWPHCSCHQRTACNFQLGSCYELHLHKCLCMFYVFLFLPMCDTVLHIRIHSPYIDLPVLFKCVSIHFYTLSMHVYTFPRICIYICYLFRIMLMSLSDLAALPLPC